MTDLTTRTTDMNRSVQSKPSLLTSTPPAALKQKTDSGTAKAWRTQTALNVIYEQSVFISYAWGDEREELVDKIDQALQSRGLKIIRDKRDLDYKGSIQEFMERIGQGDCVIVVISDKYLRSPNCMYELVEIAENKQFQNRIFPVIWNDANIYDPVKRIGYIKHWENKRAELAEAIKTLDPANLQGIREEIDLYDRIRDKISGLTSILKDMNALTLQKLQEADFNILYNAIEERLAATHTTEISQASIRNVRSRPIEAAEERSRTSSTTSSVPSTSDEPRTIYSSQLNELKSHQSNLRKYVEGYLTSSERWAQCSNVKSALDKGRHKNDAKIALDYDDLEAITSSFERARVSEVLPDILSMSAEFEEFKDFVDKFNIEMDWAQQTIDKINASIDQLGRQQIDEILKTALKHITNAIMMTEEITKKCHNHASIEMGNIESLIKTVDREKSGEQLQAAESRFSTQAGQTSADLAAVQRYTPTPDKNLG